MGHHYELPIVSFLAAVLVLLPLPWHWKARNVATLSLITWLFICNILRGVNAIIWMDNVLIRYRIWCDIATKLLIGVSVALPACSFTLTRHLEHVASARYVLATASDKKRRRIIDLCFTFGLPALIMALHYIVQGHRFDILEDFGCQPVTYTSVAGILIVFVVPIVLSLGSLIYAALALRHFAIRRMEFEQHLRNSKSSLTTARYMRLMALALTEMFWGTSLGSFIIFENISKLGLRPWISWDDVHYDFGRIAVYPDFLMPNKPELFLAWWIVPSTAILFFIFFGFSDEAREGYVSIFRWTRRTIFRKSSSSPLSSTSKLDTLPQYRREPPTHRMRLSLDEISIDFASLKKSKNFLPPSYSPPTPTTAPHDDDWDADSRLSVTTLQSLRRESPPAVDMRHEDNDSYYARTSASTFHHERSLSPSGIQVSTIGEIH